MFGFRLLAIILGFICLAAAGALVFHSCPEMAEVDAFVLDDSYHVITMDKQRDLVLNRTIAHVAWLTQQGLIRCEDGVDQVLFQHSA